MIVEIEEAFDEISIAWSIKTPSDDSDIKNYWNVRVVYVKIK